MTIFEILPIVNYDSNIHIMFNIMVLYTKVSKGFMNECNVD